MRFTLCLHISVSYGQEHSWQGPGVEEALQPCREQSPASTAPVPPPGSRSRLLSTAEGRLPAARGHPRVNRGSSSGMLGGARPVPVHVRVRRGGTLRGGNALLGRGSCQRHREALGGQRGKVLSPVGFAQWEIIAVTQTVAGRVIFFF